MRAWLMIREHPALRRDAFAKGLTAAGYQLQVGTPPVRVEQCDLMVIWNGHFNRDEPQARAFQAAGGRLLVAENGYILPEGGEKWQHFAIAEGGHNGSGFTPWGGVARWERMGIELRPWRESGRHVVVCCQRGIGSRQMASPVDWERDVVAQLHKLTNRPIIVRRHPGKPAFHPSVAAEMRDALIDAHACVTWSSANGVRALIEGVPVIYTAPHWICSSAASRDLAQIENPPMPDRLPAMQRLAWAQWSVDEIADGVPFSAIAADQLTMAAA